MNAMRLISFASLAVLATAVSLNAKVTTSADAAKPRLQLLQNVPPSNDSFFESDITRALGSRLSDTFRRRGYEGEVVLLDGPTSVKEDLPLLTLTLSEWRVDHSGTVVCRFNATLTVDGKTQNLGQYYGTALNSATTNRGPAQDVWLENYLNDAADSAIKKLYADVADSHLVAGFKSKTK